MFLERLFHTTAVAIVILVLLCNDLHAMWHMNYPGTRAKSMGGAYTAIADDASALWYNPAGLAIGGGSNKKNFDITLEDSHVIRLNLDKTKRTFLALKYTENRFAFGLSQFSPYSYGITQPHYYEQRKDVTIEYARIWAAGLALALPGRVRIGVSAENVDIETSGPLYRKRRGNSGSFGVHWIPVEYLPWGLKIQTGGTYRLKSYDLKKEIEMWGKPESWNMGLAIMKSVTPLRSNLVLSTQYERTDFTSINNPVEFETMSYGFEWQIAVDRFFIDRLAFRAGMYQQEPKGVDSNLEINCKTLGAGIRIGRNIGIEYANERREWENPDIQVERKYTLHSVAATYTIQW